MTRIDLTNIIADKEARRIEYEDTLNSVNTAIREKKTPDIEALAESAKKYSRITEWLTVCELVNETVKNNGGTEATEEQVKITLCRARNYTKWSYKLNDKTGYYEPKSSQQRINITTMLGKLGVSTDYTAIIAVLGLYLTLAVADNIGDIAKGKIPTCYKLSKLARQHFEAVNGDGNVADPLSKRQSTTAVSNAIKAFLPTSDYKVTNFDWNWFLLVTTKRNKKSMNGVAMVSKGDLEEIFYDYVENLIRNEGTAKFGVAYKVSKKSESEEAKEDSDNLPDAQFVTATPTEEKPKTKAKTTKAKTATAKFKTAE